MRRKIVEVEPEIREVVDAGQPGMADEPEEFRVIRIDEELTPESDSSEEGKIDHVDLALDPPERFEVASRLRTIDRIEFEEAPIIDGFAADFTESRATLHESPVHVEGEVEWKCPV